MLHLQVSLMNIDRLDQYIIIICDHHVDVVCVWVWVWFGMCLGLVWFGSGAIPSNAVELQSVAGAYWRGDETKPMLQVRPSILTH